MNDTITKTASAETVNAINNTHGFVQIDELITPVGITLKGLKIDLGADYSDDVNRTQCTLVKSLICDYIAPLANRAIDHLEKQEERREARRDQERAEEHEEHLARMRKIDVEIEAIRNGKKNDADED